MSARERESYRAAKSEWSQRFLSRAINVVGARALMTAVSPEPKRNVIGVGIGEKLVDGRSTGVRAIKFFVRAKFSESHLSPSQLLPKTISGLPVDVDEVGLFRRFRSKKLAAAATATPNPRTKFRPAQPGCSVVFQDPANQFVMAGTFGALVKDNGGFYILSNNHVLADEGRLAAGTPSFSSGCSTGATLPPIKLRKRDSQMAVGLLFARSASHTIANHIDDVLQNLNVTLT